MDAGVISYKLWDMKDFMKRSLSGPNVSARQHGSNG